MTHKVLYINSSYNLCGGTPKKTIGLMKYFGNKSLMYVYDKNCHPEYKIQFESTFGKINEGFFGRNVVRHIVKLLKIIDIENVDIVQTQFSMGTTLGFLIKIFRPRIKLIIAFVGSDKPGKAKCILLNYYYKFVDSFVYVSEYVRTEKFKQFPILKYKEGIIIYDGVENPRNENDLITDMKKYSVLSVAGLTKVKNIKVLIEAFDILINYRTKRNIYLYIAGDGPLRNEIEKAINYFSLKDYVFLLGYQNNIEVLLRSCDIFVHSADAEGFGIAVAEAMISEKPIIVSNTGALIELIDHEKTGLVIDPHDPEQWANAILKLIDNPTFAKNLAKNAKNTANHKFSYQKFARSYEELYNEILKK